MLKSYIIKLLILFLLLSQFVTLAHAIEHQLVQDEDEQCLICIHETDSKNFLVDTSPLVSPDLQTHKKPHAIHLEYYLTNSSHPNIRSSPLNFT